MFIAVHTGCLPHPAPTTEQLSLHVLADRLKNPHERLGQVVVEVVLHINWQVVLQGIYRILRLLICLSTCMKVHTQHRLSKVTQLPLDGSRCLHGKGSSKHQAATQRPCQHAQ